MSFVDRITGTTLAVANLSGGVASVTKNDLEVGSYSVVAVYQGDDNFAKSTSALTPLTVGKGLTFVDGKFPTRITYGQALEFDPFVQTLAAAPSPFGGEIDVLAGGTPIGAFALNASGEVGGPIPIGTMNAGLYHIRVVYTGDGHYQSSELRFDLNIDRAGLIVSANNLDIARGDPIPPLTLSYSGLAPGETPAVLGGNPKVSTQATSNSPAGHYPIDVALGSLASANYTFKLVPGTLTVHPKVRDILVQYGTKTISLSNLGRDLPFTNISSVEVVFSDDVLATAQTLSLKSTTGRIYEVNSFKYGSSLVYYASWKLPAALDVDRLLASVDANLGAKVDPSIKIMGTRTWQFAVLPGDFDGDGIVTITNALAIRNQTPDFIAAGAVPSNWADLNGDGAVDANDVNTAKSRIGKRLPH